MNNTPSPLEYLASFALTFAAGMVASAALSTYAQWLQNRNTSSDQAD